MRTAISILLVVITIAGLVTMFVAGDPAATIAGLVAVAAFVFLFLLGEEEFDHISNWSNYDDQEE